MEGIFAIPKKRSKATPVGNSRKRTLRPIGDRPLSPRDTTPLTCDGEEIPRKDIPPIRPASPEPEKEEPQRKNTPEPEPQRKDIPKPRKKKKKVYKLKIPDFEGMSYLERVSALTGYKRKFATLRGSFPDLNIREIPENYEPTPQNLKVLHCEHDGYLDHFVITEDVSQSMIILYVCIGTIEWFLTKIISLPASGYFMRQVNLINKYHCLLYEIGEERLAKGGGRSPPLTRLLYLVFLTAVATIGLHLLETVVGKQISDVAENFVYSFLGGANKPEEGSAFDLSGLFNMAKGFFGSQTKPTAASHEPVYNE